MNLIGYYSASLMLYLEDKGTVGLIPLTDACDFRQSLRRSDLRGIRLP